MKPWPWCGKDNADEAASCKECGTKLTPDESAIVEMEPGAPAPPRHSKIFFIIGSFVLAMLAMLPLGGLLLVQPLVILMIPSGLWAFFNGSEVHSASALGSWIFYAAVVSTAMLSRRRMLFILFYVLLCVALAANVIGCYRVVGENLRAWT